MDILNFSNPYGDTILNFGVEDTTKYDVLTMKLDLNYKLYPILYLEFTRLFRLDKNLLRYFKYKVEDIADKVTLAKGSSKYFRSEEDELYSLSLDLQKHIDKNIEVTLELHLEKIEENFKFKGLENLKIYLGK